MRRFLTLSLLWLIAFAMPIQGAAAVSMTLCGSVHQGMMDAQQHDHGDVKHSHADHANHHSDADKTASDHTTNIGCSACSACCPGSAISTGYIVPLLHLVSINPHSAAVSLYAGVVPDGPEHPPRVVLI
jgi:hypothetical protein